MNAYASTGKILTAALIALSTACATSGDPDQRATHNAAIGALAGAVIGHQFDHDKGRYVGAALGALTGAAASRYQDQQQAELERALAREQQQQTIEIQRLQDETLRVSLSSEASFDFDSADLKSAFYPALNKLSGALTRYDKTVLHIIGHTDNIGDEQYNLDLSWQRASNVARFLTAAGVDQRRLIIRGMGESQPRHSNATASSRRLNRRVEIYIKPVIQGQEDRASIL